MKFFAATILAFMLFQLLSHHEQKSCGTVVKSYMQRLTPEA